MPTPEDERASEPGRLTGRAWWLGCALVLLGALAATIPTAGDIGLTWDEPSYRTSQLVSAHWWADLAHVRSRADLDALISPEALLYYWPYARYGYNFHPPLAGQLNLLTYQIFGGWMKDIPARRMSSMFEYCATITLAFGFLSRRYGAWVGAVAAGALLVMPRVYGDGHIAGTDTPGLLLWVIAALAFWKGLHEPNARKWRVVVGVALGLGFLVKMAAVAVLGPILLWLIVFRLPRTFHKGSRYDWYDGLLTSTAMILPLGLAFVAVARLAKLYPPPNMVDLFGATPTSGIPGAILLVPLIVWIVRRLHAALFPNHPIWGVERPALEIWTSILAFAPAIGWLGNPAWWRETIPRMAHYYQLSTDRKQALPDIRIMYLGDIYNFSLPWPNAWVLIAITVPAGILLASIVGLFASLFGSIRTRDAIPWYFAAQLAFLPIVRMLPTPAHDGVRLFLPTFFFLAAFAGWGVVAIGDLLARGIRHPVACRSAVAALVLGSGTWQLAKIHPFELSYYNELIGGPRGAWKAGFELSYWYDAFNAKTLEDLNEQLPQGVSIDFINDLINTPTFACLQELGELRGDIVLGTPDATVMPYVWILTHDSKANPFTRLAFAMEPMYAREPEQLDGLRVVTVDRPEAVARAWALDILTRGVGRPRAGQPPTLAVDPTIFEWARNDPEGLREAARQVASRKPIEPGSPGARLAEYLHRPVTSDPSSWQSWVGHLLRNRPEALVEAVEILNKRPEPVRSVVLRPGYTDPATIGGYLDQDFTR
ncbi:ArnT family glycosyltransferase [Tundrisphaera lichenicola]|uniref:ArnT family glycosyltransferase n=1 Tax=Tundrisphaera lichenicola TaxID=2029860 RepID=UPI003EBC2BA7